MNSRVGRFFTLLAFFLNICPSAQAGALRYAGKATLRGEGSVQTVSENSVPVPIPHSASSRSTSIRADIVRYHTEHDPNSTMMEQPSSLSGIGSQAA